MSSLLFIRLISDSKVLLLLLTRFRVKANSGRTFYCRKLQFVEKKNYPPLVQYLKLIFKPLFFRHYIISLNCYHYYDYYYYFYYPGVVAAPLPETIVKPLKRAGTLLHYTKRVENVKRRERIIILAYIQCNNKACDNSHIIINNAEITFGCYS